MVMKRTFLPFILLAIFVGSPSVDPPSEKNMITSPLVTLSETRSKQEHIGVIPLTESRSTNEETELEPLLGDPEPLREP